MRYCNSRRVRVDRKLPVFCNAIMQTLPPRSIVPTSTRKDCSRVRVNTRNIGTHAKAGNSALRDGHHHGAVPGVASSFELKRGPRKETRASPPSCCRSIYHSFFSKKPSIIPSHPSVASGGRHGTAAPNWQPNRGRRSDPVASPRRRRARFTRLFSPAARAYHGRFTFSLSLFATRQAEAAGNKQYSC
jgi:hypothetical protein